MLCIVHVCGTMRCARVLDLSDPQAPPLVKHGTGRGLSTLHIAPAPTRVTANSSRVGASGASSARLCSEGLSAAVPTAHMAGADSVPHYRDLQEARWRRVSFLGELDRKQGQHLPSEQV